ncbi:MAG TPA: RNA polymerase sigma factor SigM [Mycobacteriales bacterium]|nr:RNA polymerase sigma factor SigM [Mycobacteriales bacterium]
MTTDDLAAEQDAEDRALINAHLGGDPRAFDTLVRRHQQRMWAVALRTLRDPEEAADAVQDACLSAFRGAAGFRGEARVSTWLHRIVVNACLDRARRRAVRPTVPLPEQPPADPRDRLAERETGLDVEQALAALPEEQRVALVLVELEGLSVAEAAEILRVPEGTVKSRCFRGRARLALQLGHLRNPGAAEPVPPVTPTVEGGLA